MPDNKIRPKWVKLPASFREQIDSHYGTWVNMPHLRRLLDSAEYWQKRYHDLAEHVFKDWKLEEHLLINRKSPGRPKEDHTERDRSWLKQMDRLTAKGMSQRKASEIVAKEPEARRYNVTARYIRNVVIKLQKSDLITARRADAETSARR